MYKFMQRDAYGILYNGNSKSSRSLLGKQQYNDKLPDSRSREYSIQNNGRMKTYATSRGQVRHPNLIHKLKGKPISYQE